MRARTSKRRFSPTVALLGHVSGIIFGRAIVLNLRRRRRANRRVGYGGRTLVAWIIANPDRPDEANWVTIRGETRSRPPRRQDTPHARLRSSIFRRGVGGDGPLLATRQRAI